MMRAESFVNLGEPNILEAWATDTP